jgi:predicted house-cleaning noncanonical NTP pyrophosphatase (MazG superfamily)
MVISRLAAVGLQALFLLLPIHVDSFLFPQRTSKQVVLLRSSVNDNYGDHYYGGEKRGSSYMSNHAKRDLAERRQVKRFHQMASMDRPAQNRAYPPRPYPPQGNGYEQQYRENVDNMRRPMPPQEQQQQQMQQQPPYNSFNEPNDSFNQDVSASLRAMTEILKEVKNSQKTQSLEVELLSKKCDDMANRLSTISTSKKRKVTEEESSSPFGESLDGNFNDNVKDFVVDKSTEDYVDELSDLKAEINRLVETMMLTEDKLEQKMDSVYQRLDNGYQRLGNEVPMDEAPPFGENDERPLYQPQPPPMSAPIEAIPSPPPEDPYYDPATYYMERNAPYTGEMGSKPTALGSLVSANDKKSGHRYEQQPQNQSFISSVSKAELNDKRMSGFGIKPPMQQPQPPPRENFRGPVPPPEYPPEYFDEPYFYEEESFMVEPFMDEPYGGFDEGFYY